MHLTPGKKIKKANNRFDHPPTTLVRSVGVPPSQDGALKQTGVRYFTGGFLAETEKLAWSAHMKRGDVVLHSGERLGGMRNIKSATCGSAPRRASYHEKCFSSPHLASVGVFSSGPSVTALPKEIMN